MLLSVFKFHYFGILRLAIIEFRQQVSFCRQMNVRGGVADSLESSFGHRSPPVKLVLAVS